jgi:hypothetical protein
MQQEEALQKLIDERIRSDEEKGNDSIEDKVSNQ